MDTEWVRSDNAAGMVGGNQSEWSRLWPGKAPGKDSIPPLPRAHDENESGPMGNILQQQTLEIPYAWSSSYHWLIDHRLKIQRHEV